MCTIFQVGDKVVLRIGHRDLNRTSTTDVSSLDGPDRVMLRMGHVCDRYAAIYSEKYKHG